MPLSPPISPAKLRDWVAAAQPNARLIYGEGPFLADACASDVKELVMALADKGWLTPHFQKAQAGHPPRYLVQRTHRPFLRGSVL